MKEQLSHSKIVRNIRLPLAALVMAAGLNGCAPLDNPDNPSAQQVFVEKVGPAGGDDATATATVGYADTVTPGATSTRTATRTNTPGATATHTAEATKTSTPKPTNTPGTTPATPIVEGTDTPTPDKTAVPCPTTGTVAPCPSPRPDATNTFVYATLTYTPDVPATQTRAAVTSTPTRTHTPAPAFCTPVPPACPPDYSEIDRFDARNHEIPFGDQLMWTRLQLEAQPGEFDGKKTDIVWGPGYVNWVRGVKGERVQIKGRDDAEWQADAAARGAQIIIVDDLSDSDAAKVPHAWMMSTHPLGDQEPVWNCEPQNWEDAFTFDALTNKARIGDETKWTYVQMWDTRDLNNTVHFALAPGLYAEVTGNVGTQWHMVNPDYTTWDEQRNVIKVRDHLDAVPPLYIIDQTTDALPGGLRLVP